MSATSSNSKSDVRFDIHDSPVWMAEYSNGGYFMGETARILLSLELDGSKSISQHWSYLFYDPHNADHTPTFKVRP